MPTASPTTDSSTGGSTANSTDRQQKNSWSNEELKKFHNDDFVCELIQAQWGDKIVQFCEKHFPRRSVKSVIEYCYRYRRMHGLLSPVKLFKKQL